MDNPVRLTAAEARAIRRTLDRIDFFAGDFPGHRKIQNETRRIGCIIKRAERRSR